jgi:hypothetical protein
MSKSRKRSKNRNRRGGQYGPLGFLTNNPLTRYFKGPQSAAPTARPTAPSPTVPSGGNNGTQQPLGGGRRRRRKSRRSRRRRRRTRKRRKTRRRRRRRR